MWTPRLSCRIALGCCSGAGLRCGRSLSRTPPHSQLLPAAAPGPWPGSPPGPRGARTCPGVVTRITLTKHPARKSHPRRITTRPPGRSSWLHPREPGRESSLPDRERPQHRQEFGSRSPAPTLAARREHPLLGSHWPCAALHHQNGRREMTFPHEAGLRFLLKAMRQDLHGRCSSAPSCRAVGVVTVRAPLSRSCFSGNLIFTFPITNLLTVPLSLGINVICNTALFHSDLYALRLD